MAENIALIEPHKIHPNEENPRIIFREDELLALEDSIKRQGILVPLTVFADGKNYTILDGERRWRCASKLGLSQVPAIVQPKPDKLQNIMMMFAIHKTRRDWDPLPTAQKLQQLENELERRYSSKPTEDALASAASITRGEVRRYRRILGLPEDLQSELMEELNKPRSEQILTVDHVLESTRAVEAIVKRDIVTVEEGERLSSALIDKFRSQVERSTVGPRQLPKIARAVERGDVSVSSAQNVLRKLIVDRFYTTDDAFREVGAESEASRDLQLAADRLAEKIGEHLLKRYPVSRPLKESLVILGKKIEILIS
ncbi:MULTISPECIES: ParB/RepB/Spo0J family partition protein [Phyllobacteriaceae]|jgi:ParB family transcriptional regulator, chromosome partitioning protein|uniref:ParB-like N-terminal domain-containing protein n=1 Tax=Mesorhizobium hungaricum TaxID=1566387 RepID=A0A1C2DJZ8_9HYPH|nr:MULTISPECIES: ParB/RepB/Spo0J family partition protein [Mesorhizobium]MBN9233405.1 ParB/RepB/Spo0J family partition protein [Mesorhizobium sp.]OCX14985.1 hypothetical protein QV13_21555 [Mesorhizobium hungaricum]